MNLEMRKANVQQLNLGSDRYHNSATRRFQAHEMGLKNAPATFTRLQEFVFPPLDWSSFLKDFIDDMCIFADSIPELARYLDRFLSRVIWAGLKLAPQKCFFGTDSVKFLGHIITKGQITMDPKKIEAIRNLLPPLRIGISCSKFLVSSSTTDFSYLSSLTLPVLCLSFFRKMSRSSGRMLVRKLLIF
jgi:hypothetical protein